MISKIFLFAMHYLNSMSHRSIIRFTLYKAEELSPNIAIAFPGITSLEITWVINRSEVSHTSKSDDTDPL